MFGCLALLTKAEDPKIIDLVLLLSSLSLFLTILCEILSFSSVALRTLNLRVLDINSKVICEDYVSDPKIKLMSNVANEEGRE